MKKIKGIFGMLLLCSVFFCQSRTIFWTAEEDNRYRSSVLKQSYYAAKKCFSTRPKCNSSDGSLCNLCINNLYETSYPSFKDVKHHEYIKKLDIFLDAIQRYVEAFIKKGYTLDQLLEANVSFENKTYQLFPTNYLKILALKNIRDFFFANYSYKEYGLLINNEIINSIIERIEGLQKNINDTKEAEDQKFKDIKSAALGDSPMFYEDGNRRLREGEMRYSWDQLMSLEETKDKKKKSFLMGFTKRDVWRLQSERLAVYGEMVSKIMESIIANYFITKNVCNQSDLGEDQCKEKLEMLVKNKDFTSNEFKGYIFRCAYCIFLHFFANHVSMQKPEFFNKQQLQELSNKFSEKAELTQKLSNKFLREAELAQKRKNVVKKMASMNSLNALKRAAEEKQKEAAEEKQKEVAKETAEEEARLVDYGRRSQQKNWWGNVRSSIGSWFRR